MMEASLVSIIIPCYNAEKYLTNCLDSVLRQDWSHFEIICINDGSSDRTQCLLDEMQKKDNRIFVYSQENKGVAMARDFGVKVSKGEYITFLDADDTLIDSALSLMMERALSKDSPDIVVSSFNIIQNDKIKRNKITDFHSLDQLSYLKMILTGMYGWELCAKLFKREIFTRKQIHLPDFRMAEDGAVLIQLICASKLIRSCSIPIYNYIQHPTSATHTKSIEYVEETLKAGYFVQEYLKQYDFYNSIKDYVSAFHLLLYSTSTRRGYLNRQNKYIRTILNNHLRLKSLILIPYKKAIYVFFMLKLRIDLLLKLLYKIKNI